MALPFGTLIGFFVPVFTSGVYEKGLTVDQQKQKIANYLMKESIWASAVFVLTFLLWIPGHSKASIMRIIRDKQRD